MWGNEMEQGSSHHASRLAPMLRRGRKSLLVVVTAALLAGCGSGDEGTIPSGDADDLINLLNAVEAAVAEQDCGTAQDNADQFVTVVNNLPSEVDDEVKDGLRQAGERMTALSRDPGQCETEGGATGPQETTTAETTTEQEPTTSSTTEETTTEEEPAEDEPVEEEPETDGGPPADPGNADPGPGNADPPGLDVGPGTDTGGIGPGERRTP